MYSDTESTDWNAYAALLQDGAAGLAQIRAALLARAEAIGRQPQPDPHLIVDDIVVLAEAVTNTGSGKD